MWEIFGLPNNDHLKHPKSRGLENLNGLILCCLEAIPIPLQAYQSDLLKSFSQMLIFDVVHKYLIQVNFQLYVFRLYLREVGYDDMLPDNHLKLLSNPGPSISLCSKICQSSKPNVSNSRAKSPSHLSILNFS